MKAALRIDFLPSRHYNEIRNAMMSQWTGNAPGVPAPRAFLLRQIRHLMYAVTVVKIIVFFYFSANCSRYSPTERVISREKSESYFRLQNAFIQSSKLLFLHW